jgi:hypothetical protein
MVLGDRTSLNIYLQPWSESMALAPSISWISPYSPKSKFLSSYKIEREIFGFEKKLFSELVPFVEMTLVSNFI